MKKAFTLAETLITLAIIGIIAAVAIPSVLHHHRKSVIEKKLVKFYQQINEAIRLSEIDHGSIAAWDKLEWGYNEDDEGNTDYSSPKAKAWFDEYLKPYLNFSKVEYDGTSLYGYTLVYFTDGSLLVFGALGSNFYPFQEDLTEEAKATTSYIDRALSGIKFFTFYFYTENNNNSGVGLQPYMWGWDGSDRNRLLTSSSIGCQQTVSNQRAFCTKLIQLNGWKIPDDYFYKF